MKSIILTDDHKSKLLEMCKKLFPEYNIDNELYGGSDYVHFTGGKEIPNIEYDEFEIDECIHWFEFCMTHLPVRIFHKKNEEGGRNLEIITKNLLRFEDFGRYEINPIDYLYKEFKKLKK